MSARIAGGLRGLGVEPLDRVGVVIPQSPETGLVHLAIWRLGAVSLPLAALFGPDALRFRIRDAGAKLVVTTRANAAKVHEAAPEVHVLVVEDDLAELLASDPVDIVDTGPDDPAFLIYTSGTTGPPKGALEPHRSVYGHLPGFELLYEFAPQPGDLIWTPADWAWIGALMDVVVPAWFHGIPVVTSSSRIRSPTSDRHDGRAAGHPRLPAADRAEDDAGGGRVPSGPEPPGDLLGRRAVGRRGPGLGRGPARCPDQRRLRPDRGKPGDRELLVGLADQTRLDGTCIPRPRRRRARRRTGNQSSESKPRSACAVRIP